MIHIICLILEINTSQVSWIKISQMLLETKVFWPYLFLQLSLNYMKVLQHFFLHKYINQQNKEI